jgi:hypothetical protein
VKKYYQGAIMVRIVPKFLRKDKRKHPIIRDDWGKSARARCFNAFEDGKRPVKIAKKLGLKPKTVYQYHWQWKKLPSHFEESYRLVKYLLKKWPEARNEMIETLSKELDLPEYKIELWLQSPWGLKQIKSGKWKQILEKQMKLEESSRNKAAMLLINAFKYEGLTYDDIYENLQELVDKKSKKGKTASSNNPAANMD